MQSLHKIETVYTLSEWERYCNRHKRKIAKRKLMKRLKQARKILFLLACFFVTISPIVAISHWVIYGYNGGKTWLLIGLIASFAVILVEYYKEDWSDASGKYNKNNRV